MRNEEYQNIISKYLSNPLDVYVMCFKDYTFSDNAKFKMYRRVDRYIVISARKLAMDEMFYYINKYKEKQNE